MIIKCNFYDTIIIISLIYCIVYIIFFVCQYYIFYGDYQATWSKREIKLRENRQRGVKEK